MTVIHKKSNKNIVHDEYKHFSNWSEAIEATERLLLRIQVRDREVRAVIRLFKERLKAGDPWPTSVSPVREKARTA